MPITSAAMVIPGEDTIIEPTDKVEAEAEAELPGLTGSDKQVAWASKIRTSRMNVAKSDGILFGILPTTREQSGEFLKCLRSIRRAHWWIETRTLGRGPFMLDAFDEGLKARYVTPPKDNATAHAVLAEALLAPAKTRGPIAEVSMATGKVRVVLIEFDENTNTLLKRCGYRWDAPAWVRPVA